MRIIFVRLFFTLLSWMPLPVAHGLGNVLGRVLMWFPNDMRDIARINIQRCFPHWSARKRHDVLQRNLQETVKAILELGAIWLWPVSRVLFLVKEVSGEDLLKKAVANGKGVILMSPHLGAWEVVGLYCSHHWPMTSLYRPPKHPAMNGIMQHGRERAGAKLVPTGASGVRSLYKALGRGELIGVLPDQDPDSSAGVFAPFFGIQANTMTLLQRLAGKTGAAVLTAYAERLPHGKGFKIVIQEVGENLLAGDEQQQATKLNQAIERCVLQLPEQYLWSYKRFKTRPQGEERFY